MSATHVVLVVEDNAELRHVLKEALAAQGYEVLAARDEVQAMDVLREHTVDLLISDLTDAAAASRALEDVSKEFPDLPVVALSQRAGGYPGLKEFRTLPKPFRLDQLLAVLRDVLRPANDTEQAR